LRGKEDIFDTTIIWIPKHVTLDNFRVAAKLMDYFSAMKNTIIIAVTCTILQTLSCTIVGYGFARLKFKGSNLLFSLVIFTIVVPPQTIMIPSYLNYRFFDVFGLIELITGNKGVNLIDTFWPFIISSATATGLKNGLYIYIFRQTFRGLPKEIEEAAYVDGCSIFKTFYKIMLPNSNPSIVTVALFSFVWQWNDCFYVGQYLSKTKVLSTQLMGLPSAMNFIDGRNPIYDNILLNAGSLLVIAPLIIIYLFCQRYFVEGVERTGIVG
jgi:multiple sugar transport system permease protein